ncbi:MAG: response regulator [Betaproteobacteria bacterium]|nr:response regulator [Betaproteobacteria bacterium]
MEPSQDTAVKDQEQAQPAGSYTVLCVDDEANILGSLRRLFRPEGYRLLTAESGAAGLAILEAEPVDLVISDMRMPEMNGAQFLEQVRARWPDTVRLLLTGYADIGSTIEAINKGQIYRYLSKPWDDNDMLITVRQALERKAMERENQRLTALTRRQNEELRELNTHLETKVKERTAELQRTLDALSAANEKLKGNFLTTIKVFSTLMGLRFGDKAGRARQVTELARRLALKLGLEPAAVQDVTFAGMLKDVGKLALPDELLTRPEQGLRTEEFAVLRKYPLKGEAALMAIEELRGAAKLLRSHRERFDGMGYPDGLRGLAIPQGARILALAHDYEALQAGMLINKRLSSADALTFIQEGRGKRYDPQVVDAFFGIQGAPPEPPRGREIALRPGELKASMVLSRDILSRDGVLLLSADYIIDQNLIGQLKNFEETEGVPMTIHVRADR